MTSYSFILQEMRRKKKTGATRLFFCGIQASRRRVANDRACKEQAKRVTE